MLATNGVRQTIVKPDVIASTPFCGGQEPCAERTWRVPANHETANHVVPAIEAYLLDVHQLPLDFVERVADVACEAIANAGWYSRPDSEAQIICFVTGRNHDRDCTVRVFNLVAPGTPKFPSKDAIARPDLGLNFLNHHGRGLAIMKERADHFALEDILDIAKEVTLVFHLASKAT